MTDLHDSEGQEMFISMEGIPLRQPEVFAKKIIYQLKNFPVYLLGASNTLIGKIIASAFEVTSPAGRVTLFWVQELQQSDSVLQIMLATQQGAVASNLVMAMQHKLINYNNFEMFKKSASIAIWEFAPEDISGYQRISKDT